MKVLIVDDDLALADVVSFIMKKAGFEVILAHDGKTALDRWRADAPDLIILDLNLPKLDGFSVLHRIRLAQPESDIPVIILSVRGEEDDIVKGLKLGADDYIVKPFSPRQMLARVEAVLRRTKYGQISGNVLAAGDLTLDLNCYQVQRGDTPPKQLTKLESRLLEILLRNNGQVVPTEMLIDHIWGPAGGDRVMLKQLVYRLRRKIEPDPSSPVYLETRSNIGYSLIV